jgi:hypothetical protein
MCWAPEFVARIPVAVVHDSVVDAASPNPNVKINEPALVVVIVPVARLDAVLSSVVEIFAVPSSV